MSWISTNSKGKEKRIWCNENRKYFVNIFYLTFSGLISTQHINKFSFLNLSSMYVHLFIFSIYIFVLHTIYSMFVVLMGNAITIQTSLLFLHLIDTISKYLLQSTSMWSLKLSFQQYYLRKTLKVIIFLYYIKHICSFFLILPYLIQS